jgi:protein-S-isoprenylcysteine O-methyltransferase Ste14
MPYWLVPRGTRPDLHGVGAVGGVLIAAGIALYFACAFWGFALRGRGTPLPMLRRKFGEEYEAYSKRVPRWLPRLRSKVGEPGNA